MAVVLIVGGGGREHALAWKLAQSPKVSHVYVAPGNGGTATGKNMSNVSLDFQNHAQVAKWCHSNEVSLVVVGPEDPLAMGLADDLQAAGVACFGPCKRAAQIEASKEFAKAFMDRQGIPTARWKSFCTAEAAREHIMSAPYQALVVKTSGLAAGKGVIVAKTREEACQAADNILQDKAFGSAGDVIVVEELLVGEEVSVLCFSDGQTVSVMPPSQDHKRLKDGDEGPNTGGMGAYCPYPLISAPELQRLSKDVLQKAVDGLRKEGIPFVGVLYAGVMLTSHGPRILEFNCRFGDPETQVMIPLLESDLYDTMMACVRGQLANHIPQWRHATSSVGVVLAMSGYPGSYQKGKEIKGLEQFADDPRYVVFHAGTSVNDHSFVTSGGRVLIAVALGTDLELTARNAQEAAAAIHFDGVQFRSDIAHKALKRMSGGRPILTYRDSGVDIKQGDALVQAIKPLCSSTYRAGVTGGIGGFGGLFDMKAAGFQDPILVSGTDGVGTKLKVAQACGIHNTIGIDLVAMCVNDVLAHAAEPLFFLDYYASGKLDVEIATKVVAGISEGCKRAGCSLIGGETAELPGMYEEGVYDIAGFAVGAVERGVQLPLFEQIKEDDVLIGVASSGIHSNGYSLVRKVLENSGLGLSDSAPFSSHKSLAEELLVPTRIYTRSLLRVLQSGKVFAYAHITGGGLVENVPRVLPTHLGAVFDATQWDVQPVFKWISAAGNVKEDEMIRTFNCGLGAVLVVDKSWAEEVISEITNMGEMATVVGKVVRHEAGTPRIEVQNIAQVLRSPSAFYSVPPPSEGSVQTIRRKVGVLISGSGTNLQALIDHTQDPRVKSSADIVLVISNIDGVEGLKRAERAKIPTKVINHKEYKSREDFDRAVTDTLKKAGVEIVCLAGFMRILSAEFTKSWKGKLLNIHPSLLPSFKGIHAHRQVLQAGVRVTGCTVHFVEEEVDDGAILAQETVPVYHDDTENILEERVKAVEHRTYPRALEMLCSGKVKLGPDGKLQWL